MLRNTHKLIILIFLFTFFLNGCVTNESYTHDDTVMYDDKYKKTEDYLKKGKYAEAYEEFEYTLVKKYYSQNESEKEHKEIINRIVALYNKYPSMKKTILLYHESEINKTSSVYHFRHLLDKFDILYKRKVINRKSYDTLVSKVNSKGKSKVQNYAENKAENKAEKERLELEKQLALLKAIKKSIITCSGERQCKKVFALTQIFINKNSTVKIQLATDTIIETYNITEDTGIAMKAIKTPQKGTKEEISITVLCELFYTDECYDIKLELYKLYPKYIKDKLGL